MFRDESKSVVRKAKAGAGSSPSSRGRPNGVSVRSSRTASPDRNEGTLVSQDPAHSFRSDKSGLVELGTSTCWARSPEVQPSTEASREEAICFFLRGNAVPGNLWMGELLDRFLAGPSTTPSMKAMQSSLLAVSSAMLCRARKIRALTRLAQEEYVSALNLLNTALTDVEDAKSNQALGAVILLAMYELRLCPSTNQIVTTRAPRDINQWTKHISGATALLHLRGPEQVNSEIGLKLFLHLRYQIVISCIQRTVRVPESLLHYTGYAISLRPAEAQSNRLIMVISRLASLRADLREGILTDSREVLATTSSIEADLVAWLATLPPEFNYQTHTVTPHELRWQKRRGGLIPYDGQYHEYPNIWICNTWNQYRCTQIIIDEIALEHIRKLSQSSTTMPLSDEIRQRCRIARAKIRRLAVEICRSIPCIVGAHLDHRSPSALPPERCMGGLMVLWPLFLAGIVERPGHSLRRWVIQCLRLIGHTFGLDQALATMDIVAADAGILRETDERAVAEEIVLPTVLESSVTLPDVHYSQVPASSETII
ncbi:hypothetical protein POX_c03930 [Penicillium oxalicum]|uniref:hypothetical protein n=1 Tax=Penicillium oxalicum TaxID=69781 RepID=UPI0020B73A0E|nr:hypothetical protein POX_c03930 [Penicillium oxalicum]KAI2791075.1 hypothetical protein POX_c03930 [Penicillium oxalicum]